MNRRSHWEPPSTPFRYEHVIPLGVTRKMIERAVEAGRIERLHFGVYVRADAVASEPTGKHLQMAQAVQLVRRGAVASHHTAALAWQLPMADPAWSARQPVALTLPASAGARSFSSETLRIRVRALPARHRALHPSGLLLTTPARTAADLATDLDLPDALIALDAAARMALVDHVGERNVRAHYTSQRSLQAAIEPLREAAAVAATRSTRTALSASLSHVDPRRESPLESLSYGRMVQRSLPLPAVQARVTTHEGTYWTDFLWAEEMVIGEADGMGKYRAPEDLYRENDAKRCLSSPASRLCAGTGPRW